MKNQIRRTLVSVGWGVLGILLLTILLRPATARVMAGEQDKASFPEITESAALDQGDWQVLLLDAFDSDPEGDITSTGSADYSWGRVITGSEGFTDTLWCVQGAQGASLTAGLDPYTNGVTTTLTYGPLDLRGTQVELQFAHWISVSEPDGLEWGVSSDGGVFTYTEVSAEPAAEWYTTTLTNQLSAALAGLLGQDSVYVAFRFHSNDDDQLGQGVFLDNVRVRVQEEITAAFTTTAPACLESSVHFSDTSSATSGIAGIEWDFGDGITSTTPITDHVYASAGTYTVWLTATSQLGSQLAASIDVQVSELPTPAIAVSSLSTEVGITLYFTDTGGTDTDLRQWDFGDGNVTPPTASRYAQHVYQRGGPRTVVLTVTSADTGCSNTAQKTLAVRAKLHLPLITNKLWLGYYDDFSDPDSGWPTWHKLTHNSDGSESENHRGGYLIERGSAQMLTELAAAERPLGVYEEITDDGERAVYVKRAGELSVSPTEIAADEDEEVFYAVVRDDGDEVFLTSPRQVPADFVYTVWARYVWIERRFWGNEYGILITKDPVHPGDAKTVQGYSFQAQLNTSTDGGFAPAKFVAKRWDRVNWKGGAAGVLRYTQDNHGYFDSDVGAWNKFTMVRYGSTFKFYMNDHLIGEEEDTKYTGPMYVGFFFAHTRDASYDVMVEWDDVAVTKYP